MDLVRIRPFTLLVVIALVAGGLSATAQDESPEPPAPTSTTADAPVAPNDVDESPEPQLQATTASDPKVPVDHLTVMLRPRATPWTVRVW